MFHLLDSRTGSCSDSHGRQGPLFDQPRVSSRVGGGPDFDFWTPEIGQIQVVGLSTTCGDGGLEPRALEAGANHAGPEPVLLLTGLTLLSDRPGLGVARHALASLAVAGAAALAHADAPWTEHSHFFSRRSVGACAPAQDRFAIAPPVADEMLHWIRQSCRVSR